MKLLNEFVITGKSRYNEKQMRSLKCIVNAFLIYNKTHAKTFCIPYIPQTTKHLNKNICLQSSSMFRTSKELILQILSF